MPQGLQRHAAGLQTKICCLPTVAEIALKTQPHKNVLCHAAGSQPKSVSITNSTKLLPSSQCWRQVPGLQGHAASSQPNPRFGEWLPFASTCKRLLGRVLQTPFAMRTFQNLTTTNGDTCRRAWSERQKTGGPHSIMVSFFGMPHGLTRLLSFSSRLQTKEASMRM